MDLRANAIITAVDRFSGPVGRMAGALSAITGRAAAANNALIGRGTAAAAAASKMGRALSGPMAMGLGATIYATQEFERRMLGIQMASMAAKDEFGKLRQVNDIATLQKDAEALKGTVMQLSKELGFSPTGLVQAGEAAAKLGVSLKQSETVMRNAAIWNMAESDYAPSEAAEFLGKTAALFNAPQDERHEAWLTAMADKIATTAAASPTDLSTFSEGLRQFGSAFAVSGGTIDQANAMLGTMTMMGQNDIESGTALKMGLVRLISPTLGHLSAMNKVGVDRSKYLDMTGADPRRSVNQLVQLFPGYIDKALKRSLFEQLETAVKAGKGADPEFIGKIAGTLNKATGGKDSIEDTHMKVLNAITTSGGKVDYYGYLRDLAEMQTQGKLDDASFIEMFSKFHFSRMKSLLSRPDLMDQYLGLSQSATGEGQNTRGQLYRESDAGRWDATVASLQRTLVRLRESAGIQSLITGFERIGNAISSLPPNIVEILGGVAAGLTALGAAGLVIGGIGSGLGALAGVGAGAAAMGPLGWGITGAAAAGFLGYEAYQNWDSIKSFFQGLPDKLFGDAAASQPVPGAPAVDRLDFGQRMIRDIDPTAGPQTIDITGKVQADVAGTVTGKVDVNVDVKVDGGVVTDKRVSGGELTGSLNKGKSMPDTTGP